jgi:hypothetical protein
MAPSGRSGASRRLYLDTSAYLCILLGEESARELSEDVENAELFSSVLLILEAQRNLLRLARDGALTPQTYQRCMDRLHDDIARFTFRDLTLDLCTSREMPAVTTPRSLDLVHLRTAAWFHAESPLDRFVTVDGSQAQAARELGLPT